MDTRINGAATVGITALGATAAVLGVAGFLAFGPRHEVAPAAVQHSTNPAGCVMFCDEPAPPPADGHGCSLFCNDPALPPATDNGCRLFCELETLKEENR